MSHTKTPVRDPNTVKTITPACSTVGAELGYATLSDEYTRSLLAYIANMGIAQELAAKVVSEGSTDGTGDARQALLGKCAQCGLVESCPVRNEVVEIETVEISQEILRRYSALPEWFQAAIRRRAVGALQETLGYDYRSTHTVDQTEMQVLLLLAKQRISLQESVLSGASEEQMPGVFVDDIPELAGYRHYKAGIECPVTRITTRKGIVLEIIDASASIDNDACKSAATEESRDLCGKLFEYIVQYDENGVPLLYSSTTQRERNRKIKRIVRARSASCYEVKQGATKNRLYILREQGEGTIENPYRVIIMGGHGGDERTQKEFISKMLS